MQAVQREIAQALKVQPPFADAAALDQEVARRVAFIKDCLANARTAGAMSTVCTSSALITSRQAWASCSSCCTWYGRRTAMKV